MKSSSHISLHTPFRLRQHESKLATLTIINGALQKENEQLRKGLDAAQHPGSLAEEELLDLKEEFARRLGAADRTVAELRVRPAVWDLLSLMGQAGW